MRIIETLEQKVGLPFKIGPSASHVNSVPPSVTHHIAQGRLWHLVAWSDEESGTVGLWHKGSSILLHRGQLTGIAVMFMRPAKGSGWVALEAIVQAQPSTVSLLQTIYNPDALAWLLQHQSQLSRVFGHDIAVYDGGSDY